MLVWLQSRELPFDAWDFDYVTELLEPFGAVCDLRPDNPAILPI